MLRKPTKWPYLGRRPAVGLKEFGGFGIRGEHTLASTTQVSSSGSSHSGVPFHALTPIEGSESRSTPSSVVKGRRSKRRSQRPIPTPPPPPQSSLGEDALPQVTPPPNLPVCNVAPWKDNGRDLQRALDQVISSLNPPSTILSSDASLGATRLVEALYRVPDDEFERRVLGFDTEGEVSMDGSRGKPRSLAMIQLSTQDTCALFHLSSWWTTLHEGRVENRQPTESSSPRSQSKHSLFSFPFPSSSSRASNGLEHSRSYLIHAPLPKPTAAAPPTEDDRRNTAYSLTYRIHGQNNGEQSPRKSLYSQRQNPWTVGTLNPLIKSEPRSVTDVDTAETSQDAMKVHARGKEEAWLRKNGWYHRLAPPATVLLPRLNKAESEISLKESQSRMSMGTWLSLSSLRRVLENPLLIKAGQTPWADGAQIRSALGIRSQGLVDLEYFARILGFPRSNLAFLASAVLGVTLDKSQQLSDWSSPILSPSQIAYAACDAWASRQLLLHMLKMYIADHDNYMLLPSWTRDTTSPSGSGFPPACSSFTSTSSSSPLPSSPSSVLLPSPAMMFASVDALHRRALGLIRLHDNSHPSTLSMLASDSKSTSPSSPPAKVQARKREIDKALSDAALYSQSLLDTRIYPSVSVPKIGCLSNLVKDHARFPIRRPLTQSQALIQIGGLLGMNTVAPPTSLLPQSPTIQRDNDEEDTKSTLEGFKRIVGEPHGYTDLDLLYSKLPSTQIPIKPCPQDSIDSCSSPASPPSFPQTSTMTYQGSYLRLSDPLLPCSHLPLLQLHAIAIGLPPEYMPQSKFKYLSRPEGEVARLTIPLPSATIHFSHPLSLPSQLLTSRTLRLWTDRVPPTSPPIAIPETASDIPSITPPSDGLAPFQRLAHVLMRRTPWPPITAFQLLMLEGWVTSQKSQNNRTITPSSSSSFSSTSPPSLSPPFSSRVGNFSNSSSPRTSHARIQPTNMSSEPSTLSPLMDYTSALSLFQNVSRHTGDNELGDLWRMNELIGCKSARQALRRYGSRHLPRLMASLLAAPPPSSSSSYSPILLQQVKDAASSVDSYKIHSYLSNLQPQYDSPSSDGQPTSSTHFIHPVTLHATESISSSHPFRRRLMRLQLPGSLKDPTSFCHDVVGNVRNEKEAKHDPSEAEGGASALSDSKEPSESGEFLTTSMPRPDEYLRSQAAALTPILAHIYALLYARVDTTDGVLRITGKGRLVQKEEEGVVTIPDPRLYVEGEHKVEERDSDQNEHKLSMARDLNVDEILEIGSTMTRHLGERVVPIEEAMARVTLGHTHPLSELSAIDELHIIGSVGKSHSKLHPDVTWHLPLPIPSLALSHPMWLLPEPTHAIDIESPPLTRRNEAAGNAELRALSLCVPRHFLNHIRTAIHAKPLPQSQSLFTDDHPAIRNMPTSPYLTINPYSPPPAIKLLRGLLIHGVIESLNAMVCFNRVSSPIARSWHAHALSLTNPVNEIGWCRTTTLNTKEVLETVMTSRIDTIFPPGDLDLDQPVIFALCVRIPYITRPLIITTANDNPNVITSHECAVNVLARRALISLHLMGLI